ncbi:MAG: hypothetical protein PHR68_00845 [Candidatus Gracilibacteria bacterium]|nr:hypothetical protein [Candidatus Gracilibacteria bacterium]
MKRINKKVSVLLISAIFLTPLLVNADLSVSSDGSVETSTMSVSNDGSVNIKNQSSLKLEGKIDGYKVILNWEKYNSDFIGYKIVVDNAKGEEKTISISIKDKTSLENWNATAGKNKYKLYVIGKDNNVLSESNDLYLSMGPNGGYDFSDGSNNSTSSGVENGENKTYTGNLTDEEKTQLGYIMKSLEEELKSIRESINKDNLVEMKTKTETLKNTYLEKVSSMNTSFKDSIEKRFEVFYKNQFELREKIENKKEKIKDTMSGSINEVKEKIKEVKQTLIVKYKEKFIKQLGNKLDNISDEKLKLILDKIVVKRENISNNAKLTSTSKEKLLAQLDALTEIINEKLGITNNDEINVDEIISQ